MKDSQFLKALGKRISLRRKALGLTQEQVAEQMNVSVQMISNLEQGRKAIRPENLVKLSGVLQISTDYLLMGKGPAGDLCSVAAKLYALSPEQQSAVEQIIDLFSESASM